MKSHKPDEDFRTTRRTRVRRSKADSSQWTKLVVFIIATGGAGLG
jgi:hypothetical protein